MSGKAAVMPNHALLGILVIAVPTAALLFALFALGVIGFGKLSGKDAAEKPARQPPFRPRPRPPELSEKEKRRAERRARRRNL
jgi:hypothetical protein